MAESAGLFRLDGRIVVITGAASGIGKAAAELLAEAGGHIVLTDRDADAAHAAAVPIEGAEARALDVGDPRMVEQTMAEIASRHGRIDVLVNNAGINRRRPALECAPEDFAAVLAVNVDGAFACARQAARHMPEAGGTIVSTASIMGFSGGGLYPNVSYATAKGAIVNMTRALAVEWAERGIRVNAVAPTWTRTPFIGPLLADPSLVARIEAMTPMRRLAEPIEVAAAILFLACPASSMTTGHTLTVDGGFLAQ